MDGDPTMEHYDWNDGWLFCPTFDPALVRPECTGLELESVRIPHTVKALPYNYCNENDHQRLCGYRREFFAPAEWAGRTVLLTFGAIAHDATVFCNGRRLFHHGCGYTAFTVDLTSALHLGKKNVVAVRCDSREDLNIPPFGGSIDYLTYGGIYRAVSLDIKEPAYLRDVFVEARAEGDFRIYTATVGETVGCTLQAEIRSPAGSRAVYRGELALPITGTLNGVHPWSIEHPTLFNRLTAGLLAAVLCLSVLAGCAAKPQKELTRYSTIFYDVFDTVTQVIAYCESEEEFTKQMEALHADLISYNQLYDIYNDYDGVVNVKTINDNAGKAPVQVDDRILSMLELAQKMYDTTNGKLNVAMGSVLNIWHNYREAAESHQNEADNTLPTQEELEAAAQHCDINNVVIDEQAKTVYLADPEMSLDVGSVGKGYAVEMVCQAAQARGLTSALVSVGGNLRAIGKKPDGSQWTGGVENPWNASEVYTTDSLFGAAINMSDMALVTSGDYQRYFVVDGKRYHHLIDPDTLWPAAYFNSVTVLCPDSGMADCLTTGLFCMPLEEGQKLVESLDGVEAMWCTPDQQAVASSGWESHTRQ